MSALRSESVVPALGEAVRTACVVIVDDDPAVAELLRLVLSSSGIQRVHALTDPRGAAKRCRDLGADLILLDLHMPHLDGFDVLDEVEAGRATDEFLPVIMLTGDTRTATRDRALQAGARDFLTKPFDLVEVELRVRNLLQTRTLYTRVQDDNAALRAEIDARDEHERRREAERRELLARIDTVLTERAIRMAFQPIADLGTGRVLGVEALARFDQPPLRPPNVWFEEATTVGRGTALELAAVDTALHSLTQLPAGTFLSVNISPASALAPQLLELLSGAAAERVVLELTEHAPVEDYEPLMTAIERLRSCGVRFAVDDAGAGYAGLRHVLRLRPDILKLDTGLTRGVDHDPARRALATALVAFAEEIGATIVAEGIETEQELDTLRKLHIPWGQGYHLARPGPLAHPN
jgi:EAL domain-containing protein (putative c-di-GMP-specific phosphodiesterase class I)/ActR/RegA family two-component response regulator